MDRRAYLSLALAGVVGCGTTGSQAAQQPPITPTATPAGETATPPDGTPTAPPADVPEIDHTEHELVTDESEYSRDTWLAVTIENTTDLPTGQIELTCRWYAANDDVLGDDTVWCYTLAGGATWQARVDYTGSQTEAVARYEFRYKWLHGAPY